MLRGGDGDDRLQGGPGDDRLDGGPGVDSLKGGPGSGRPPQLAAAPGPSSVAASGRRAYSTQPLCTAQRLSSWRLESCSLRSTAETWASTVFAEMPSRSAISL